MCTDVDRNDKSRVCVPGSVRVIGRRQIEMYSRLIHTVDHVEGRLRPGFDALDAFLAHAWAVTVTGAPKLWAMQFIEDHEQSPRAWYGGAVGMVGFDGNLNTGLTLRTIRIKDGIAEVRAGATLLYDSDPRRGRAETDSRLPPCSPPSATPAPATAQRRTRRRPRRRRPAGSCSSTTRIPSCTRSPTTSARPAPRSSTLRTPVSGRGARPADARPRRAVARARHAEGLRLRGTHRRRSARELPVFGVCLGLQGLVEPLAASSALDYPMHGKASRIRVLGGRCSRDCPRSSPPAATTRSSRSATDCPRTWS